MSKTDYSACYDLPSVVRGDTVDSFRVTVLSVDKIDDVSVDICRKGGTVKTALKSTIEGNAVVVHSFSTSNMHQGVYTYTMRFSINGRERTYLAGKLNILGSCNLC